MITINGKLCVGSFLVKAFKVACRQCIIGILLKCKIVYNSANSWFWHTAVALSRTPTLYLANDLLSSCVLYIYIRVCFFFTLVVAYKTLIIFLITKDTSFACSAVSPTRKPSFLPASPFVRFFNRILPLFLYIHIHIYIQTYIQSYLYIHTVYTWGWNKTHIGF